MSQSLNRSQNEAVTHLNKWKVGALFMEPGTGKTRVAVELVNATPAESVLWVGPYRTIHSPAGVASISEEVNKWGGFRCACVNYVGVESIGCSDRIFLEVRDFLIKHPTCFIVVDESIKIKNSGAKRTKRLMQLSELATYKLVLNGTPLTKNLLDLWPQMTFLSPMILNMSEAVFKNTFCCYTTVTKRFSGYKTYTKEYITGYENIDYLYSLIRHYVYECDLSLRIKQNYEDVSYSIGEEERETYMYFKEKYLDDEMLQWKNNNIFLEMTQKMQHSYCVTQGKFDAVDEIFKDIPQDKTLIFCKYIDSANECRRHYPKAMVVSYQKESLGLNLQDYRYTIYFDKIWDLALRMQSSRRTYRTGQEYDCKYYDLTGNVGLESLIDRNIEKKVGMLEYFKGKTKEELKSVL